MLFAKGYHLEAILFNKAKNSACLCKFYLSYFCHWWQTIKKTLIVT